MILVGDGKVGGMMAGITFFILSFSNVSLRYLPENTNSHIGCICLSFLQCVFSGVWCIILVGDGKVGGMMARTTSITSLQWAFLCSYEKI